ncbi:MAG: hypothetical protein VYD57_03490 [Pseudomonadota bacterium]|nr:hypothetical protein [Pseudomonadota bacterium]
MSAVVRPAGEADIEPVAALLHEKMNAKIAPECWRLLLDYPWRPKGVERGWLVEDAGRIVGFMGTIYSDRPTRLGPRRFCDLSSWFLLADYRGDGTGDRLLRSGMARPGVTYQTMTARRATGRKIRALGFSILDATRSLFSPDPTRPPFTVIDEPEMIRQRLTPEERDVFDAHRGLAIHQALVGVGDPKADGGRGIWLLWQRKLKGDAIAYHDVLHASDAAYLSAEASAIAASMVSGERGVLSIDTRFMNPRDDQGTVETIPLARWYRSPDLSPGDIDHLFSEVLLLDQKLP